MRASSALTPAAPRRWKALSQSRSVKTRRILTEFFPLGTTTINVVGSLILGIITGLAARHGLNALAAVVAGVGFCGGFTTFSTWTWETLALAEARANRLALVNVIGSLGLGLAAAAAGLALTN